MKNKNKFEQIAAYAMAELSAKDCLLLVVGQLTARSVRDDNKKLGEIANKLMPVVYEIENAEGNVIRDSKTLKKSSYMRGRKK